MANGIQTNTLNGMETKIGSQWIWNSIILSVYKSRKLFQHTKKITENEGF